MDGACSTIAGRTNLDILKECAEGAAAVIAIGTCATFGGLPGASPNPTGAVGVAELMGISLAHYERYETGYYTFRIGHLYLLRKIFSVRYDDFFRHMQDF